MKIVFFILIIYILNPPINHIFDLIIILLTFLTFYLTIKIKFTFFMRSIYIFLPVFIILIINIFLPKNFYNEAHQVFVNKNDLSELKSFIPKHIFLNIQKDFNNNFNFKRSYTSHPYGEKFMTENKFT